MRGTALTRDVLIRQPLAWFAGLLSLVAIWGNTAGAGAGWTFHAALLTSAALGLLRALRAASHRVAWCLAMLGLLNAEITGLLLSWSSDLEGVASVAPFVIVYPLLGASMFLLLRGRMSGLALAIVLDGVITGLGTGMVLAAVLLSPWAEPSARFALPPYLVLDLLIVTVLGVVLALAGWRTTTGLALSLMGVMLAAVGDASYAIQQARGLPTAGTWRDAVWVVAYLSVGLASGRELLPVSAGRLRVPHLAQLLLPVGWIVAAGVLLAVDRVSPQPVTVLLLAALTSLLALLRMVLSVRDVQSLAASRIEARTDALTSLPNRRALYERLDQVVETERCSLLILDLDGFKEVNDSLGHHHGDALLTEIGKRLHPVLREDDLLARLGGDEFAVVLGDAGPDEALVLAHLLLAELRLPFELDDVRVHVEGSVGIASSPLHSTDVHGLMRRADIAMYQAKQLGDSVAVYGETAGDPSRERLKTVNDLRDAMTTGDSLVLHYQPKFDLASGQAVGVEALVRWRDATGVLRLPDTFLPLATQAGLMGVLTDRVLDLALDQLVVWRRLGVGVLNVAVNLPAASVVDAGLPRRVETALGERGLPGAVLTLEITEQSLLVDRSAACQVLQALRSLGVSISIDDFGTGYSSLAYLRDLPIDELKLDKGFIRPMVGDARAAALVRSTIDLTHSLGLRMVAEGVEDRQTWDALRAYGCDQVQGFYLTPAVPADVVVAWLGDRIAAPGPVVG